MRQCYSETSTPRWLPPHSECSDMMIILSYKDLYLNLDFKQYLPWKCNLLIIQDINLTEYCKAKLTTAYLSAIMSAPLGSDNMPPPPYQQYFLERQLMNSLKPRSFYENVTLQNNFMTAQQGGFPPQPPSPTEQIPISFNQELPYARVGTGLSKSRNPGYYFPYNPNNMNTSQSQPTPTPIYSSAAYLPNTMNITNSRPMLSNPLENNSLLGRLPMHGSPLGQHQPRTHVYDEIVVPEEILLHPDQRLPGVLSPAGDRIATPGSDTLVSSPDDMSTSDRLVLPPLDSLERPPIPPRPTRTPSRSPPAIPTSICEEQVGWGTHFRTIIVHQFMLCFVVS